jgi:hypothetical protein
MDPVASANPFAYSVVSERRGIIFLLDERLVLCYG